MTTIKKEVWNDKERYVARDDKGHFVSWSNTKDFTSFKQFKNYVQSGGYKLGKEVFLEQSGPTKIGKNFVQGTTDELVKSKKAHHYVVTAEYTVDGKTYYGNSAVKTNYEKRTVEDAKLQAIDPIAQQIIMERKGFVSYDQSDIMEHGEEIEAILNDLATSNNVTFKFRYSSEIKNSI